MLSPLLILLIGLATVIGMIIVLRINAFLALLCAALVVSLLAPGPWAEKVVRVATAFGNTTASIGIVIALAAVVGICMLESGAADRVVQWFLDKLGERRSASALMSSGFVLAVPVFFDTVFYLLVPLARSMYGRTGKHYLKYLMAIAGGAAITHTLVPPTPGPLVIAATLDVDLGVMMLVGLVIAIPSAVAGLAFAKWLDARLDVPMRPLTDRPAAADPSPPVRLPSLGLSVLPILLPVLLISANTFVQSLAPQSGWANWTAVVGNANIAMLVSAALAMLLYVRQRHPDAATFGTLVEQALMSGGLIILITAAGGAFGAMLKEAQIGMAIEAMFGGAEASGFTLLLLGFFMASLLKFAQGSSTVAMITASAMLASLVTPSALGFHPVYLATAVGSGALVGSWMNDSGFWIYAKMGGLTEVETLKSWTPLLIILGLTGLATTLLMAVVLPLN